MNFSALAKGWSHKKGADFLIIEHKQRDLPYRENYGLIATNGKYIDTVSDLVREASKCPDKSEKVSFGNLNGNTYGECTTLELLKLFSF